MRQRLAQFVEAASVVVCFAALALLWTSPLHRSLSTHLLGDGAGDNVAGLWNFWWARHAIAHRLDLFQTPYLFAPVGTSLALHTHTALPALAGATLLREMPLVAAHNTVLLATLALNGSCMYWLLRRETGDRIASLIGGTIFAGSPFVTAHLHGHFNVVSAWTLPLVWLAARAAIAGSSRGAVGLGLAIGLTVYVDYYYALYALALVITLLWLQGRRAHVRLADRPQSSRLDRWLMGVALLLAFVVTTMVITGGATLSVGPFSLGLNDSFNGQQILGLLLVTLAWRRWRPRLAVLDAPPYVSRPWAVLGVAAGVAAVTSVPVGLALLDLTRHGDYVSQVHLWRSGAQGVDLATLLLGPPFHWLDRWTTLAYSWRGIDPIERSGWLGIVPVGLAIAGWRLAPRSTTTPWIVAGGGALLWALGPHLTIFGWNSGFILPNAVLRYLPVVSNARIPGRAMVVVFLAVAALSALGVAQLRQRRSLSPRALAALAVLLLLELLPGRFPLTALERSELYESLRVHPLPGAVLELPVGIRDGFGEAGRLDHRTLWYQTIHERPITGGFVARLPRSTEKAYTDHPLLGRLMASSSSHQSPAAAELPDRKTALPALRALDVRFIVLDRQKAPPAVADWVDALGFGLAQLGADDSREWYLVRDQ